MAESTTIRCVAAHIEVEHDKRRVALARRHVGVSKDFVLPWHDRAKGVFAEVKELAREGAYEAAIVRLNVLPCWLRGPAWHELRRHLRRKQDDAVCDELPTIPPPP